MARPRVQYQCNECGSSTGKWGGQCPDCNAWNSLIEVPAAYLNEAKSQRFRSHLCAPAEVRCLADVAAAATLRLATCLSALVRVLGGGLVQGSVILIGGDPGIGKATLMVQALSSLADSAAVKTLYVTGEESIEQMGLRARRLGLSLDKLHVLTENQLERIFSVLAKEQPQVIVIDSIQTSYSDSLQSAPGSVGQVRECAAQWVRFAKQTHTSGFLVGHVSKDGAIAGPRVLTDIGAAVRYVAVDC